MGPLESTPQTASQSVLLVGLAVGLADRQTPYRERMAASDDVRYLSVVLVNGCYSAPLNFGVTVHGNAMARFHIEGGSKKGHKLKPIILSDLNRFTFFTGRFLSKFAVN